MDHLPRNGVYKVGYVVVLSPLLFQNLGDKKIILPFFSFL